MVWIARAIVMIIGGVLLMRHSLGAERKPAPVFVELYTSQGCSSCPPADEVLATWGMEAFKRGEIIPLAYHVDYWDRLGWKDPFGSPEFSRRQRATARALGLRYSYTPQMLVSGRAEFNGSNRARAEQEVARFRAEEPVADIEIRSSWKRSGLNIAVKVKPGPGRAPVSDLRVMLAVFENGFVTNVPRGENAGRTLRGDFVTRQLTDVGPYAAGGKGTFEKTVDVAWNPDWKKENAGATVFLQDERTFAVYGVKSLFPLQD